MTTMQDRAKLKLVVGGVVALLLAVALGAAGALAAADAFGGDEERQAVINDAAEDLGVEPEALSDALNEALKNRIDEAVDEGRLTEEEGERLKDRIDAGDTPFVVPDFDRLFDRAGPGLLERGGPGFFFDRDGGHYGGALDLGAAASYLDLTKAELHERLRDGESLAEIARDEGKSVDGLVDVLVDAAEERIDAAVERGRLTEEEADELKDDLSERIRDRVNDELHFHAIPFGFDFEPHGRGLPG
jgi:polyhydroxyalkanoate synthesis regulator phasin